MSNDGGGDTPGRTGLESAWLATKVRAQLLEAVVTARRNLQDQEEIARETVARFKRRVARAEADARAAGIDLTSLPTE